MLNSKLSCGNVCKSANWRSNQLVNYSKLHSINVDKPQNPEVIDTHWDNNKKI